MNDTYEYVLEVSKKDIEDFITLEKQIEKALKYREILVDNITTRMKANKLNDLGSVKLVSKRDFKPIELLQLQNTILNSTLLSKIVINVNIEATKKNLYEQGFTDVVVEPLIELLKLTLGTYVERLVVNDNTNNRER